MSILKTAGRARSALVFCAVGALAASGCGATPTGKASQPASTGSVPSLVDAQKKLAAQGAVTLHILDQEGPVSAGGSGALEYTELIKKFEEKYQNVTVKRQTLNIDQLTKTLPLRLSSNSVPDVIESDQGYQTQGRLVKAGLMQPLDDYAKAWGWGERQTPEQLVGMRVRTDGTHLGEGKLYGVAASQSLVGVYYNKAILAKLGLQPPKTAEEFQTSLAKAKAAGIVPIQGGDGDHQATDWGLVIAASMNADADHVRDTYLGRGSGSFSTPEMLGAVKQVQSWGQQGYFPAGYRGITSDVAAARFSKGQGLYFMNGTWWAAGVMAGLKSDAGFMAPPAAPSGDRAMVAAPNQPWEIPAKAENKLAAALWIDFITSPENVDVFLKNGDVPATKFDPNSSASAKPLTQDILAAAQQVAGTQTQLPFEWAVPSLTTYIGGPGIGLAAGKLTPDEFAKGADGALAKDRKQYGS
jgi:raffinose/stachyose/melibiose transport system substrate-binding protein